MNNNDVLLQTIFGSCAIQGGAKLKKTISIAPLFLLCAAFPLMSGLMVLFFDVDKIGVAVFFIVLLFSLVIALLISYAAISKYRLKSSIDPMEFKNLTSKGVQIVSWKNIEYLFIAAFILSACAINVLSK